MDKLSDTCAAASIAAARAEAARKTALYQEMYQADIARWKLGKEDIAFLAKITHRRISGRALLSNGHVLRVAQNALIDAAADLWLAEPDRQRLWVTMAWDAGVSWERSPEIDLVSLKNIAYRHFQRAGLEGLGVVEIDTWKALAGEAGRRIVSHVHFLGTSATGERIKVTELEADLCGRRALTNSMGARSVVITNVRPTIEDITWLAQYMLKRSAFAKNPIPRADGNGYRLEDVEHVRGSVARLVELASHCEVRDVMFSVGSGKGVAEKVRAAVRQEIAPRAGAISTPSAEQVVFHWNRIRETCGSRHFRPCSVITRAHQR